MLAWLFARSTSRRFLMRVEDLDDRTHTDIADRQLATLRPSALTWDGPATGRPSTRSATTMSSTALTARGLPYECYCSEGISAQAPRPRTRLRGLSGDLPGPHRGPAAERRGRRPAARRAAAAHRHRRRAPCRLLHGDYTGMVDDFVVRRGDGVAAYNLAVVVDDAAQGVDQVVRGDDLLPSSPRQAYLARLLGHPRPMYAHVPLVLNEDGARLAKRDGAVTLARDRRADRADTRSRRRWVTRHTLWQACLPNSIRGDYRRPPVDIPAWVSGTLPTSPAGC